MPRLRLCGKVCAFNFRNHTKPKCVARASSKSEDRRSSTTQQRLQHCCCLAQQRRRPRPIQTYFHRRKSPHRLPLALRGEHFTVSAMLMQTDADDERK